MPSTTTNLGLYKKNPATDGNDTFDINTMLNDNWDKIDAQLGAQVAANPGATPVNLSNGLQVVNAVRTSPFNMTSIQGRTLVNLLGRDGNCEDVGKFGTFQATLALDSTNKTIGNNGIKITQTTGTSGTAPSNTYIPFKSGKYYIALADCKNGNATNINIYVETILSGGGSNPITATDKFYTCWTKIAPISDANARIIPQIVGSANQYAYIDAIRIYEITQSEYNAIDSMTAIQVAAKYPYVDDVKHIAAPYAYKYGENLLPPFNEWLLYAGGGSTPSWVATTPYSATLTAVQNSDAIGYDVPAISGQQYTLTLPSLPSGGYVSISAYDANGNFISSILAYTATLTNTVTAPTNASKLRVVLGNNTSGAGTYTFTSPMLNLGTTAKLFKPRNDDYLFFPGVQLAASMDGTVYDTLFKRDGKYWRENRFLRDMVLDGGLAWSGVTNYTGFKSVTYVQSGATNFNLKAVKYDGKILTNDLTTTAPDSVGYNPGNSTINISISSTDSGWGDSYTPSAAEIQAYFYGWKMFDASTYNGSEPNAVYNGIGTKRWVRITDKVTAATTVPTASYTGYTPYKLTYQLSTPVFEEIAVEGSISLHEGLNQIEVGQGAIVREKANVTLALSGNVYNINAQANAQSLLKNRLMRFIKIYRNAKEDLKWAFEGVGSAGNPYGLYDAYINAKNGDYDPTATYEVTYLALDQYAISAPATQISGEYASNLKNVVDALATNQADSEVRISAAENLARQIYQVPRQSVANVTMYVDATNGSDSNDGSARRPFKTIGKAISMIPQVINHQYIINVAAGIYNEDVILNGFIGAGLTGSGSSIGIYGITLQASNTAQGATNINAGKIISCKGRFEFNGFTATTTTDNGFTAGYAQYAIFTSCFVTGSTSTYHGVIFTSSSGRVQGGTFSSRGSGILAQYYSQIFIDTTNGTGNVYGVSSVVASIIGANNATLPTGTTNLNVAQGSMFIPSSSVINPWGDNTVGSHSTASSYQSSGQSLSAGATTKLIFQTKNWDSLTEYDNTTNYRFTAKHSGVYLVSASMFLSNPSSNNPYSVAVYKNGGQYSIMDSGVSINGANRYASGSVQVQLNAGDYIEIYGYSTLANTLVTGSVFNVTQIA